MKKSDGVAQKAQSFVVKVQPSSSMEEAGTKRAFHNSLPLSVYNEDRSVLGRIASGDPAYKPLKEAIAKKGFSYIKAYYRVMEAEGKGCYKINPERMVEIQPW